MSTITNRETTMAKDRWNPEARQRQRQRFTEQNPTAQGVAARKAKRATFDAQPLADALARMLSTSTLIETT